MLTDLEKKVIAAIQGDIPICARPYKKIAEKIGIDEDVLLRTIRNLADRGVIRRFGATLRHQKSGFTANAMVAWKVDPERTDEVGKIMAGFREISHCYRRVTAPDWPYNLYTMIHARDEKSCHKIAARIARETGVETYTLLFSHRELKKTSMRYFDEFEIHLFPDADAL